MIGGYKDDDDTSVAINEGEFVGREENNYRIKERRDITTVTTVERAGVNPCKKKKSQTNPICNLCIF